MSGKISIEELDDNLRNILLDDESINKRIIYVSPDGDVSSQGEIENPTTLENAFNIIKNISKKEGVIKGRYTIKLLRGVYRGDNIGLSMTDIKSLNRIIIEGESVGLGEEPLTIFDGESLDLKYVHGLAFVNCYLEVKNIKFINFNETEQITATQSRCGLTVTNCNVSVVNIWATKCSWAGLQCSGGTLYTSSGKFDNCRIGISVQFNSKIALGYNDESLSDDKRCNISNCIDAGIRLSDGVVGHIDYTILDSNLYGIVMAHHSNSNLVGNKITNSTTAGLLLENASSWYDTDNTFTNNTINILSRDNSSETTLKSVTENNCFVSSRQKGTFSPGSDILDSFNLDLYKIKGKKFIQIKHEGEISIINSGSSVNIYTTVDGVMVNDNTLSEITSEYKNFIEEITLYPVSETQFRCVSKFYLNDEMKFYSSKLINISTLNITMNYDQKGEYNNMGFRSFIRHIKIIG